MKNLKYQQKKISEYHESRQKLEHENIYDKIIEIIKKSIAINSEYDEQEEVVFFDSSDVDYIAEDSATEIIELLRENGVKVD